jgi:rare lipoprotein A
MFKIMRGIAILGGIVLIFLVITACTTDSVFAKKKVPGHAADEDSRANDKEEYFYDDGTDEGSEYAARESGKKDISNNADKSNRINSKNNDKSEYDNWYQKGYASWYGREFHGRKTASGAKYDMNKLTAAHKELPFGTKIIVKNLENGKEVSVVVNDRGPYKNSRILDLSYAAAKKIGIVGSGEAKVGIRIAKSRDENNFNDSENNGNSIEAVSGRGEENIAEKDSSENFSEDNSLEGDFSVQAGAFYSRRNAEKLQKHLEKLVDQPVVLINDRDMYKVKIDKIANKKEASRVKKTLENENIPSYVVENNQ